MKTEFDFIEFLRQRFSLKKVGDDCAVLSKDAEKDFVITADLLVENIDFRLDWSSPEQIGHKALAVSLSDIAAMGASPLYALVSLGVPKKLWEEGFVERFYEGWFSLASKLSVELIGGDVSRSDAHFFVDSILIGEVEKGKAVMRSGAKVGDLIFVTGTLGDSALALKLLQSGEKPNTQGYKKLFARHFIPEPQVEIGRVLAEKSLANAMIDISDGLSSDLWHICRASKVGARIHAFQIPISDEVRSLLTSEEEQLNLALHGGEDFQLLFTIAPEKVDELIEHLKNLGLTHANETKDVSSALVSESKKDASSTSVGESKNVYSSSELRDKHSTSVSEINNIRLTFVNEVKDVCLSCIGEITEGDRIKLVHANKIEQLQPKGFRHF